MGILIGKQYVESANPFDSIHDIPVYSLHRALIKIPKADENFVVIVPNNITQAKTSIESLFKTVEKNTKLKNRHITVIPTDSFSCFPQKDYATFEKEFAQEFPQYKDSCQILLKEDLCGDTSELVRFLHSRFDRGLPNSALAALKINQTMEYDEKLKKHLYYEQFFNLN